MHTQLVHQLGYLLTGPGNHYGVKLDLGVPEPYSDSRRYLNKGDWLKGKLSFRSQGPRRVLAKSQTLPNADIYVSWGLFNCDLKPMHETGLEIDKMLGRWVDLQTLPCF